MPWLSAGTPSPIPEQDKAAVRDNLIEAIVRAPQVVRTQLGECLRTIVQTDFPDHWPGLLPIILQNLSFQVCFQVHMTALARLHAHVLVICPRRVHGTHQGFGANTSVSTKANSLTLLIEPALAMQEQARLYGGLYALRILTRKYEFRDDEERVPLGSIVDSTFPGLLRIFQVCSGPGSSDFEFV
jgi:hypothetical protein